MVGKKDQERQQAFESYDEGDYEAAFAIWHDLALDGDANAQNNLSALYDAGEGVEKNSHNAYEWALMAVKSGHSAAMSTIGSKLPQLNLPRTTDLQRLLGLYRAIAAGELKPIGIDEGYAVGSLMFAQAEVDQRIASWHVARGLSLHDKADGIETPGQSS
jgi:TPR repeat protein